MRAVVLSQIPYSDTSSPIAADDLALVWMDDHVIDWRSMAVTSLNSSTACLPNLDRSIFRACHHPLPLAMESHASDIICMTFESKERVWIGRLDVVELNTMVTGCCKKSLVGRDAESIDLGIGVLNCSRADTRERLPESNCVVVTRSTKDDRHLGGVNIYLSALLHTCDIIFVVLRTVC